jgi:hypothetical protein
MVIGNYTYKALKMNISNFFLNASPIIRKIKRNKDEVR